MANASQMQNVFFWQWVGDTIANSAVAAALGDWVETDWHGQWSDFASNEVTIDGWQAQEVALNGDILQNIGSDAGLALAGDVISDNDSAAISAFLQANTALPKQKGRKYVTGVADARIENGLINAVSLAQVALLLDVYVSPITDVAGVGDLNPGVLSRTLVAFEPFILSGYVTDVPAYQRRRKPNVGS
jgi:hypothetical protein